MQWMKAFAAGVLLMLGVSAGARADAFDPKTVPADAKWVLHVDMDTAKGTKLWDIFDDHLQNNDGVQSGIDQLQQITGVRFPQDFHDVTLYGRSASEEAGVILCHVDADQDRIVAALQMNPDYSSSTYGNYEIHSWSDKGKTRFGAFHGKSLAIIGRSEENIKAALDTLDAKAGGLPTDSPLVGGAGAGLVAYASGEDLAALTKGNRQRPPFLPLIDSTWVTIGEQGDHVLVTASVVGKTAAGAQQMRSILEGAKAMVTLTASNGNGDARLKTGAAALASLTSKVDDKTLSIDWPIGLDLIQAFIDPSGQDAPATTEPAK
jgi:hypothetical protein